MRRLIFLFTALALSIAASNRADAALINSALVPGQNSIQDTNYERLLTSGGTVDASGEINTGDIFEGIVLFDTVNGTSIGGGIGQFPGGGANYQLTAYFKFTVGTVTDANMDGIAETITFGNGLSGGTVAIELYENTATTLATVFDVTGTTAADAIARATSGTLITSFGIAPLSPDYIVAFNAPTDLDNLGIASQASFSYGLSVISNIGLDISLADPIFSEVSSAFHNVVGSGGLKAPDSSVTGGWRTQTDVTAVFNSPEPGSITLLGFGVLSLAGYGWRRRKQSAA